jgi:hypothetical protein
MWSVDNNKCPVIDALTAICAVSSSRISPSIITSGSRLKILLSPVEKVSPALAYFYIPVKTSTPGVLSKEEQLRLLHNLFVSTY